MFHIIRSANFVPAGARDISIAVVAGPLAAIAHDRRKVTSRMISGRPA